MKKIKYILVAAMAVATLFSCKKDDDKPAPVPVPTPEAPKTVAEAKTDDKEKAYTVRLQNTTGTFVMGYNDLTLSVLDAAGKEVAVEAATFTPWMDMFKGDGKGGFSKEIMHTHTCPHTALAKEGNVWKSQVLFQMVTGPSGVWFGTITFKVAGKDYELKRLDFEVKPQTNKALGTVNRFKLFSETKPKGQAHLYALVAPESPKVGESVCACFRIRDFTTIEITFVTESSGRKHFCTILSLHTYFHSPVGYFREVLHAFHFPNT